MLGGEGPLSILRQIKQLGVAIALDDFGTGFSSLSYLQKFPFDKLKMDKSFVQGADSNEQSRKITRSMVQLGRSLGMRVTAEGVETAEQLERMRKTGCDEAQGYFFSRSVRASEVPAVLLRQSLKQITRPNQRLADGRDTWSSIFKGDTADLVFYGTSPSLPFHPGAPSRS
jgi:EAL domain-containing protein (putative c-di-GMP-specific phosphodiesterase class I)